MQASERRRKKMKQELIDKVLEQIAKDVLSGDWTAIRVLIADIPDVAALHFLHEDDNQNSEIDDISHINE